VFEQNYSSFINGEIEDFRNTEVNQVLEWVEQQSTKLVSDAGETRSEPLFAHVYASHWLEYPQIID
jgi:hypothetical protein